MSLAQSLLKNILRYKHLWGWVLIAGIFAALVLTNIGYVTDTGDEEIDFRAAGCYAIKRNPLDCPIDVSQTRLPYYLHALIYIWTPEPYQRLVHYGFSACIGFVLLVSFYRFLAREFHQKTALFGTLLLSISIPFLSASRMVMTHSNILFMLFTWLALTHFYGYLKQPNRKHFFLAAIFWGLSVSTNFLGIFTFLFFLAAWTQQISWRSFGKLIVFGLTAVAVFFLTSPFYLVPANFALFLHDLTKERSIYWYWNYLDLDTFLSPRWYSFFLFYIKFTPWWSYILGLAMFRLWYRSNWLSPVQRQFFRAITFWGLGFLLLKSGYFQYDAPHHHHQLIAPLMVIITVFVATSLPRLSGWKRYLSSMGMGAFLALSFFDAWRFYPDYLFYGAQYGQRFIGEFYGPGVLLCQDQADIYEELRHARQQGLNIITADRSCLRLPEVQATPFSKRLRTKHYDIAYLDYLHQTHFFDKNNEAFERYVHDHCNRYYARNFPTGIPIYELYRCPK